MDLEYDTKVPSTSPSYYLQEEQFALQELLVSLSSKVHCSVISHLGCGAGLAESQLRAEDGLVSARMESEQGRPIPRV